LVQIRDRLGVTAWWRVQGTPRVRTLIPHQVFYLVPEALTPTIL